MMLSFALFYTTFDPATYAVQLCANAHKNLSQGNISIGVATKGAYSNESSSYTLAYDRSKAINLTIHRARPFQVVATSDKVIECDLQAKQYAVKHKPPESMDASIRSSAGVLDELVASLMAPEGVGVWIKGLRVGKLWQVQPVGNELIISNIAPESTSIIALNRDTFLLSRVENKSNQYGTSWNFKYLPKKANLDFQPPAGVQKVGEIRPEMVPPVYASAKARAICWKVFEKYDHSDGLGYYVESTDERHSVWISGGRARQSDGKADWVVGKNEFLLLDKSGQTVMRGKTDMSKVVDAIGATGTRIDPMLKLLLRGINPFRYYFGQNANLSTVGAIKVEGQACTLLQAKTPTSKIDLVVRDSDGFVISLQTTSKGTTSPVMRRFKPLSVRDSDLEISIPAGWSVKRLPDSTSNTQQP